MAIGWQELGDLTWLAKNDTENSALDKLKEKYRQIYPEQTEVAVGLNSGQVHTFVKKIQQDDVILSPANGYVMIGIVTGDYHYGDISDGCDYFNRRTVDWKKDITREKLPQGLRNSLFAWQTVFSLEKHGRILSDILADRPHFVKKKLVIGDNVCDAMKERFSDFSPDFFQQQLIPSILQVMGFETEARAPTYSSDGGIDVSGTFRMGVFTGDVRVQVKRVSSVIGASQIRELRGSLQHGQQGIFITTSHFSRQANKEAADTQRLGGKIFLVDGERLSEMILNNYDELDEEIKGILESELGLIRTFAIFSHEK